jgi:hypothetical protein
VHWQVNGMKFLSAMEEKAMLNHDQKRETSQQLEQLHA